MIVGESPKAAIDYDDYPALKLRYECIKPSGSTDLVDSTGKIPNSAINGSLAPWTDETAIEFATQTAYATASFAAINPVGNPGVQDCYPVDGSCVLVHAYIKPAAASVNAAGILSFGGGYTMGNSGAPDGDGGSFGLATILSSGDTRLLAWFRDANQVDGATTWMNGEGMGTIPILDNGDLNDGNYHSIQVLFAPAKSNMPDRQGWILGWIDGEDCANPRPFVIAGGIIPPTSPAGIGYQFMPFFHPHNTGATGGLSFHGSCKQIQLWRFQSIPENLLDVIDELNRAPRDVPRCLLGVE